jgi:hypothetical protein
MLKEAFTFKQQQQGQGTFTRPMNVHMIQIHQKGIQVQSAAEKAPVLAK